MTHGAARNPHSGSIGLLEVRWLDIERGVRQDTHTADGGGQLELKAPGQGQWAVLMDKKCRQRRRTKNRRHET